MSELLMGENWNVDGDSGAGERVPGGGKMELLVKLALPPQRLIIRG